MCRSLKSNVQANGLYKRPQLLHLQLDTGGVVMTSAQVAEQIKSIFPLFYIQGRSSRVIIDLRCSSFFIMQTDMLYTKKRKSLNYWNSRTYNFVFLFSAERQVNEPYHTIHSISALYFQWTILGYDLVTISKDFDLSLSVCSLSALILGSKVQVIFQICKSLIINL